MQSNKYSKESYIALHGLEWWSKHPNVDAVRKYKQHIKGMVGDLGCNNGICTVFFPEVAPDIEHIVGVDINPECALKGKELVSNLNLNAKISFTTSNLTSLPYPDKHFDCLLSFHTIEHIYPEDIDFVFSEMYRCLKNNCYLVIAVPFEREHFDVCHVSFFNEQTLSSALTKHNFKTIDVYKEDNNIVTGLFFKE